MQMKTREKDGESYNPYNPKLIRVDTKPFSIRQMNEMIEIGDVDLSPDFQRGIVWNDITRKSRLIESLLLRIPIPVFYFCKYTRELLLIKEFPRLCLCGIEAGDFFDEG